MRLLGIRLAVITITAALAGLGFQPGSAAGPEPGRYDNNRLGVSFNYPSEWIEGARGPLWTCNDCAIFGPPGADPTRGVVVFDSIAPAPPAGISGLAGNNDSVMHVICLFTSAYGYSPAFDLLSQTTRTRGMTHEMGHSLHLADDQADMGTMNRCWCYNINTTEANYVNYIYAIAP